MGWGRSLWIFLFRTPQRHLKSSYKQECDGQRRHLKTAFLVVLVILLVVFDYPQGLSCRKKESIYIFMYGL